MKIAILSDIHDHSINLSNALSHCAEADMLLCCGDLCSPFIMGDLGSLFKGPVHIVFGNNDGDLFRMTQIAGQHKHITLHGEMAVLEVADMTVAMNHFDNIGRAIAKGETYDIVCFGHNHKYEITRYGKTLAINPGEVYGQRTGLASFVILDTATLQTDRIDL